MSESPGIAARLAPVANRRTARITTRGRRTGKPHTVTIWFVVDGNAIYLGTLDAKRDWVRNAAKTPAIELELDGTRVRGRAHAIADPALEKHVRALLAAKYWAAWIASWFGMGPARTFRVHELEVT
ncbi:MAG TPA: nitroreductase/quinone reductase family protein [Candidatus Binatia bacterium]|nr:nitroreductase/quinone reductase family protein [Candidatus Binatia bacterium]